MERYFPLKNPHREVFPAEKPKQNKFLKIKSLYRLNLQKSVNLLKPKQISKRDGQLRGNAIVQD